jgi:Zn-dependent protease
LCFLPGHGTLGSLPEIDIGVLFISLLVLLFSLTVHEAAHALAADRLGDPTARHLGRLSLNPLVHIDPLGTVVLPLIALATGAPLIGWAKPVPVDGSRLRNFRRDFVVIAAAGPVSNVIVAFLASVVISLVRANVSGEDAAPIIDPLFAIAQTAFSLNLLLAVFNMVPIPPLDGGNVLGGLLPARLAERYDALRPFGIYILYALMLTGALSSIIGPPYLFLARLLSL